MQPFHIVVFSEIAEPATGDWPAPPTAPQPAAECNLQPHNTEPPSDSHSLGFARLQIAYLECKILRLYAERELSEAVRENARLCGELAESSAQRQVLLDTIVDMKSIIEDLTQKSRLAKRVVGRTVTTRTQRPVSAKPQKRKPRKKRGPRKPRGPRTSDPSANGQAEPLATVA